MTRVDDLPSIAVRASADDALAKLVASPSRAVVLLDESGATAGVITADAVVAWLARAHAVPVPAGPSLEAPEPVVAPRK